jgi:hypothetical protein
MLRAIRARQERQHALLDTCGNAMLAPLARGVCHIGKATRAIAERRKARQLWRALRALIGELKGG